LAFILLNLRTPSQLGDAHGVSELKYKSRRFRGPRTSVSENDEKSSGD
jgi:hypothetical protein